RPPASVVVASEVPTTLTRRGAADAARRTPWEVALAPAMVPWTTAPDAEAGEVDGPAGMAPPQAAARTATPLIRKRDVRMVMEASLLRARTSVRPSIDWTFLAARLALGRGPRGSAPPGYPGFALSRRRRLPVAAARPSSRERDRADKGDRSRSGATPTSARRPVLWITPSVPLHVPVRRAWRARSVAPPDPLHPVEHPEDHHAGDRDVRPQRQGEARDPAMSIETPAQGAHEGHAHQGHDGHRE